MRKNCVPAHWIMGLELIILKCLPGCFTSQPVTRVQQLAPGVPPTYSYHQDAGQHSSHQSCFGTASQEGSFQGVFVWCNFEKLQNLPSPGEWGWDKVDRGYSPVWSTLPDVWKSVQELISCTCKKGCKSRCKCVKEGLKCCALCDCEGDCVEDV